jgi:hypothetical protein
MERLEKTISINAPPTTLLTYLSELTHLQTIWPGLITIEDIQRLAHGGRSFRWARKLCDVRFEGVGESSVDVNRQQATIKTTGGLVSEMRFGLTPEGEGTQVTLAIDYVLPTPLFRKYSPQGLQRQYEHEAEILLLNLNVEIMTHEADGLDQKLSEPSTSIHADPAASPSVLIITAQ